MIIPLAMAFRAMNTTGQIIEKEPLHLRESNIKNHSTKSGMERSRTPESVMVDGLRFEIEKYISDEKSDRVLIRKKLETLEYGISLCENYCALDYKNHQYSENSTDDKDLQKDLDYIRETLDIEELDSIRKRALERRKNIKLDLTLIGTKIEICINLCLLELLNDIKRLKGQIDMTSMSVFVGRLEKIKEVNSEHSGLNSDNIRILEKIETIIADFFQKSSIDSQKTNR